MGLLSDLTTDSTIEESGDSVGGIRTLKSNIYDMNIDMAYVGESSGGAKSLTLHLKDNLGNEMRSTIYMTSGTKKGCKNYYERDGVKRYLPGFNQANAIALLSVGKEISELDTEDKVIKIWNSEAKKEIPTKTPVIVELLDEKISLGIIERNTNASVKNDSGNYVNDPTGKTRMINAIDKVFRTGDYLTVTEIKAESDRPEFKTIWLEKWEGKTDDKVEPVAGTGAVAGAPPGGSQEPAKKLFT